MRTAILLMLVILSLYAARPLVLVYDYGSKITDGNTLQILRNFEIEHAISTIRVIHLGPRISLSEVKSLHTSSTVLIVSHESRINSLISDIAKPVQYQYQRSVWIFLMNGRPCYKHSALHYPEILSLEHHVLMRSHDTHKYNDAWYSTGSTKHCIGETRLEKQHLRVGTLMQMPGSYPVHLGNTTVMKGTEIDTFAVIAESLHLTYEFVQAPDSKFQAENSTSDLASMLLNKDVDVAVNSLAYTNERTRLFDSIWPTYIGSYALLVPPPTVEYNLTSNVKPFQTSVWLAIIASIVIVSAIISAYERSKLTNDFSLSLLYNLSLILGQGGFNPINLSGRFLLTGWNLGAVVILFAYTSVMISFITAPIANFPVKNFADFIVQDTLKPVSNKNTFLTITILQAKVGNEKQLGDMLRKCSSCIVANDQDAINMVLKGGYGFFTATAAAQMIMVQDFRTTGKCRLALRLPEDSQVLVSGWYISKDFKSLSDALRTRTMMAFEGGIVDYIYHTYFRGTPCYLLANLLPKYEDSRLTIIQLQTAFALLGVGWFLALVVFVSELATKRTPKHT